MAVQLAGVPPVASPPKGPGLLERAKAAVLAAWKDEPSVIVSSCAAVIVFLAAKLGIVVPEADVLQALGVALPVLIGGGVIRHLVTPTH